jgi:hypothetical protein
VIVLKSVIYTNDGWVFRDVVVVADSIVIIVRVVVGVVDRQM